jgi:hypothetical protein
MGVNTFHVGDRVQKVSGYRYPGIIVSIFITTNKELRYVVEADSTEFQGMLHIFNKDQLELREPVE